MQRPGPEIAKRDNELPQRVKRRRTDSGNPGTNGLLEPDGKIPGSAGLGGGHDRDRTCDPLIKVSRASQGIFSQTGCRQWRSNEVSVHGSRKREYFRRQPETLGNSPDLECQNGRHPKPFYGAYRCQVESAGAVESFCHLTRLRHGQLPCSAVLSGQAPKAACGAPKARGLTANAQSELS